MVNKVFGSVSCLTIAMVALPGIAIGVTKSQKQQIAEYKSVCTKERNDYYRDERIAGPFDTFDETHKSEQFSIDRMTPQSIVEFIWTKNTDTSAQLQERIDRGFGGRGNGSMLRLITCAAKVRVSHMKR
ncbi:MULTISPECIES: hypothetical protein [unclassified Sphingomonas]|uniref:hypothetical protein n=1 Tax=unclassified Sphingomonas TaxID=196159 RepID=UPI000A9B1414|nr:MULTISPECIES: hypothetical protein [unclassified Sphingomonas]